MKRRFSPRQYAERLRRQRRRLYLQDGVLSVRFIKFINEPEPAPKSEPVPTLYQCNHAGCDKLTDEDSAFCPEHQPGRYYTDSGEKPTDWLASGFDAETIAKHKDCPDWCPVKRAQKEPVESAEDWARSLTLGGITPPWTA